MTMFSEFPAGNGRTGIKGLISVGFIKNIKEEIAIIRERDAAIHSSMEVFLYPSFKAMIRILAYIGKQP